MSYDFKPNYEHMILTNQTMRKYVPMKRKPKHVASHVDTWLTHLENLMHDGDMVAETMLKDFYDRKTNV